MPDPAHTWFKISESPDQLQFSENGIATAEVGERKICLALFRGNLFAFAQLCPHAAGLLSDGYIDARGNVVCPVHLYKFSIRNGNSAEGYYLKTYPVKVLPDGVYVDLPA